VEEEQGLRIALSPVQLAAVLSDRSVSEGESASNRISGGLGLAGGNVRCMRPVRGARAHHADQSRLRLCRNART